MTMAMRRGVSGEGSDTNPEEFVPWHAHAQRVECWAEG